MKMTDQDPAESAVIICILLACVLGFIFYANKTSDIHVVVKYDCRIAIVSPDVPGSVKEACRRKITQ